MAKGKHSLYNWDVHYNFLKCSKNMNIQFAYFIFKLCITTKMYAKAKKVVHVNPNLFSFFYILDLPMKCYLQSGAQQQKCTISQRYSIFIYYLKSI